MDTASKLPSKFISLHIEESIPQTSSEEFMCERTMVTGETHNSSKHRESVLAELLNPKPDVYITLPPQGSGVKDKGVERLSEPVRRRVELRMFLDIPGKLSQCIHSSCGCFTSSSQTAF